MTKHRDFQAGEVTVYVWTYRGPSHPGHAAIKLTGLPDTDRAYISWWPAVGAGLRNALQAQEGNTTGSYKRDMYGEMAASTRENLEAGTFTAQLNDNGRGQRQIGIECSDGNVYGFWGQDADEKIKLPPWEGPRRPFGLDIARMAEWWKLFQSCPHPRYQYASKSMNCAGVAAAALKVGGAENFVAAPKGVLFLDPNQIARWARQLRAEFDRRNDAAAALEEAVTLSGKPIPEPPAGTDLMPYATWKQLSSQNTGRFALRSQKIREIDELLKEYHAYDWEIGMPRFQLLGKIMDVIHHYLAESPTSQRAEAVLILARDVLMTARGATQWLEDQGWDMANQALWTAKT